MITWIILAAIGGIIGNNSDRISLYFFNSFNTSVNRCISDEQMDNWSARGLKNLQEEYEFNQGNLNKKMSSYDSEIPELSEVGGAVNERKYMYDEIIDEYSVLNMQLYYIEFQPEKIEIICNYRDGLNMIKVEIIDLYSVCYGGSGSITLYEYMSSAVGTEIYIENMIENLKPNGYFVESQRTQRLDSLKTSLIEAVKCRCNSCPGLEDLKDMGNEARHFRQPDYVEEVCDETILRLQEGFRMMKSLLMQMDRKSFDTLIQYLEEFRYDSWLLENEE